jgi:putative DNA-invertase from lambdoid prophage Rac
MLEYGYSKAAICRKLKCNPKTLDDHLKRMQ